VTLIIIVGEEMSHYPPRRAQMSHGTWPGTS